MPSRWRSRGSSGKLKGMTLYPAIARMKTLHPSYCSISSPPVGTLFPALQPPWHRSHPLLHSAQVLVPGEKGECSAFRLCLLLCAQAKVTLQPPQGLLQPLPIPHRLWSHIALDFVTDLPISNHHTTILTIIDFQIYSLLSPH